MLEVICGPMFSGKSEELIRRIRRAEIAKQRVVVFKHALDDRYCSERVMSHLARGVQAQPLQGSRGLSEWTKTDVDLIAIDEAQFFDDGIVGVCRELAAKTRVVVAGLDLDAKGEPFGPMPALLALADKVVKLTAVCMQCGEDATRSFQTDGRVTGMITASAEGLAGNIQVGAAEAYEARCSRCWRSGQ